MGSGGGGGVPPGFRFHPTDEELLHYYLKKKVSFQKFDMEVIREVDLNKLEPWDLQEKCKIGSTPQNDWYFFSHKDRKYPTGSRTNRATNAGFWKATGRDKCIRNCYKKIGMRKTLVFYRGRAPHGQKTDWIMHEYRLEDAAGDDPLGNNTEDGWVVCRVFKKKNLFKVGNEGGSSSVNSDQHINNHSRSLMGRENQYLVRPQQNYAAAAQPTFELNKSDLSLHYMAAPNPHYSHLFQPPNNMSAAIHKQLGNYDYAAALSLPPDAPVFMMKQISANPPVREAESGTQSFRYQSLVEVESSGGGGVQAEEGMNESWAVLDRLVSTSQMAMGGGNDDEDHSGKEVRFHDQDQNGSSVSQINQLSLRGEMNFWGYGIGK